MKPRLLQLLACPGCYASLQLEAAESCEIVSGKLRCPECGSRFPIRDGIPRFVPDDAYASTFSLEWKKWRRTQFDTESRRSSELSFLASTGQEPEDLAAKLVLDAGCGSGRYMDVVARAGAEVVGLDLSFAVEVAQQNLGRFPQCHFVQADLMRLPFRPESFDFVYSIGVLPFTPHPRRAFLSMARSVRRGGAVAVWVYPRRRLVETFLYFPDRVNEVLGQDVNFRLADRWQPWVRRFAGILDGVMESSSDLERMFTTRLPPRWLYALCHAAIPLYHLYRVPLFYPLRLLSRIAMNPDPEWRVLETFDWYSPRYQWKYTFAEVQEWFEQAGLAEIKIRPRLVAVSGVKVRNRLAVAAEGEKQA